MERGYIHLLWGLVQRLVGEFFNERVPALDNFLAAIGTNTAFANEEGLLGFTFAFIAFHNISCWGGFQTPL
jgi:hypothetical protein